MYGGGKGMGGGGGRAIRALGKSVALTSVSNIQETFSSSSSSATGAATSPTAISRSNDTLNSSNNVLCFSSATGSPIKSCNTPVSANHGGRNHTPWPCFPSDYSGDECEWVYVDGCEEERAVGVSDDFFLGPVPSLDEVHGAVSALTQVFDAPSYSQFITDRFAYNSDKDVSDQISGPTGTMRYVSMVGSDSDWMEPYPHVCNSGMLHSFRPDTVYDAFQLLQSEPSIQRMVISLSSDKSVWDAVLNNEVVQELCKTYNSEESVSSLASECSEGTCEDSSPAMNVVMWIFQNTMEKFMEVMEKISKLVSELFKISDDEKKTDGTTGPFEDKLRVSFLLSMMVVLVVVVNRVHKA